ncbi:MAG: hypothetical protein ACK4TA_04180 [Saprospiraceae bacterium]
MRTNEKNHQTLQNAVNQLPTYEPSPALWQAIDRVLTSEETLDHAIENLPTYAPPVAVWERIIDELDQPVKVKRLRPAWIGAAAAALVILTLGTYFWRNWEPQAQEKVELVYQESDQPLHILKTDWNDDEALMEEVVEAFAQKASFIQNFENQQLISEWQELKEAKNEAATMLRKYGKDAEVVRTIAEIERQRSAIVKQMATEI